MGGVWFLAFWGSGGLGAQPLPGDCLPLAAIRPGMVGEARSVMKGFAPEIYRVEILGIEQGALPGSAIILARVEGPGLAAHGIVAGMSGSPVYIDGKVIGAIAYGWSFAYQPIAGITPIEHMMAVWKDLDAPAVAPGGGRRVVPPGARTTLGGGWDWMRDWEARLGGQAPAHEPRPLVVFPKTPEVRATLGEDALEMVPLTAPWFISSTTNRTFEKARGFFESRGLRLFGSGSSAGSNESPSTPSPAIVAGSSLALPIMTGDVTIASIGTVTYLRDGKLLAFGHPAFAKGAVEVPMGQAAIFGYMPSYSRSFKLGEAREVIGSLRQDRLFGVGGVIGAAPERIGLTVEVGGMAASLPRAYQFSIWEDRDFLQGMVDLAFIEAFAASAAELGEATAETRYRIRLADGSEISKRLIDSTQGASGGSFFQLLMQDRISLSVLQDLFLLLENPYEQVDLESISIQTAVEPGFRTATLEAASPRYVSLRPGDPLEIDMLWQPYRGERFRRRERVELPAHLLPGAYVVHLADAAFSLRIDQRHDPSPFQPLDLAQTVQLARRLDYPLNQLRIYVFEPAMDVAVRAASLDGLPPSIRGLVAASAPPEAQTLRTGRLVASRSVAFEHPITARASFTIEIVKRRPE